MTAFNHVVHQYFDSLAIRHKLQCVFSDSQIVRFANEKVFLQIRFSAHWSFEIGVEIGEIPTSADQLERPFNLTEILRLYASPDASYVDGLQTSKPDVLTDIIKRLSVLTEKYASNLLDGLVEDFLKLRNLRDKECAEYALSRDLKYARKNAEKAWKDKNYFAVIKAYEPFNMELTKVERKRLAYAEKHGVPSNCPDHRRNSSGSIFSTTCQNILQK